MSPPETVKSPAITVVALRIVAVPVVAPNNSDVAAPPTLNVVAVLLATVKALDVVKISPPFTNNSPVNTVFAERIDVLPAVEPMFTLAEPPSSKFVVVVFAKFNDAVPTMSPPETVKSPTITVEAFLIVAVPVVAPNSNDVAAPPTLNVVAVVFAILRVVAVDRISPPFTCKSPVNTVFADRIVVLPAVEPINTLAAPPSCSVVAVVFARVNVRLFVVMSPP